MATPVCKLELGHPAVADRRCRLHDPTSPMPIVNQLVARCRWPLPIIAWWRSRWARTVLAMRSEAWCTSAHLLLANSFFLRVRDCDWDRVRVQGNQTVQARGLRKLPPRVRWPETGGAPCAWACAWRGVQDADPDPAAQCRAARRWTWATTIPPRGKTSSCFDCGWLPSVGWYEPSYGLSKCWGLSGWATSSAFTRLGSSI